MSSARCSELVRTVPRPRTGLIRDEIEQICDRSRLHGGTSPIPVTMLTQLCDFEQFSCIVAQDAIDLLLS